MNILKRTRSIFFAVSVLCLQALILVSPIQAQTPPDIEAFFPKPKFGNLAVSPSGEFLAFPDYRGQKHELVIVNLKNKSEVNRFDLYGRKINWVKWAIAKSKRHISKSKRSS